MKTFLTYLIESQDYENMFTSFLDDIQKNERTSYKYNSYQESVKDGIEWAKKVLKKNDRIVWFLRFVRFEITKEAFGRDKALQDFNRLAKTNFSLNDMMSIYQMQLKLEHFMSSDNKKIQSYVFNKQSPEILFAQLEEFEKEGQVTANDDVGAKEMWDNGRLIAQEQDDNILIKFPDGYAWIDLESPSCRQEGNAMGHCGNTASYNGDDTILSLRKSVNYNGDKWWYPVCTFVLDGNGELGEMKGRNNDKPQNRYHPYIISLLKRTDLINGIKGGGWMPQNNFSLNDLTKQEKQQLIKINPNLLEVGDLYREEGMTSRVLSRINSGLDIRGFPYSGTYEKDKHRFAVYKWGSFESFVRYDNQVKSVLDICIGDSDAILSGTTADSFIKILEYYLPDDWQEKFIKRAEKISGEQSSGMTSDQMAQAGKILISANDDWYTQFEEIFKTSSIVNQAWERLAQYVDCGWNFYSGAYVTIPSDVEDLKNFVTNENDVVLYVDEKDMIEIASSESDNDYSGTYFDYYRLQQDGWEEVDEYTYEKRIGEGLIKGSYNSEDTWIKDVNEVDNESFIKDYINRLAGESSGKIPDDRQGELVVEKQLNRLKILSGLLN
jgi:hypothetical protein